MRQRAHSSWYGRKPLFCILSFLLIFSSSAYAKFPDQSATRLPPATDRSYDVAFGDVDSDNDLDMYVANADQDRLLLNDGSGVFADTSTSLPAILARSLDVEYVDVDGDLDLDLFVATSAQNQLLLNDGTGVYTDVTTTSLPLGHAISFGAAVGDVDGINGPDIVAANAGSQNQLLLNDGNGVFTDVTTASLPVDTDYSYDVELGDVDGDGDLDLMFANFLGQNRLYLNDGSGHFTDATMTNLPALEDDSSDVELGDVDGINGLDIFVANVSQQNRLYLNNGDGTFSDATATHLPADDDFSTAARLGDMDNDGDLDLVISSGAQDRYLQNDGSGHFSDLTAGEMPVEQARTFGLDLGDVDGDGDLDIALAEPQGPNRLLMNPTLGAPLPISLDIITPTFVLSGTGATTQLVVEAGFTDGITRDVTLAVSGTLYTSGNSGVVAVGDDGLLTAVYTGTTWITATNSGAWDTAQVHVITPPDNGPPVAVITLPAGGAAVTEPTPIIGTADDPEGHLAWYELSYRYQGETAWTSFAGGNSPVVDGPLGTLDPTLLLNGMYEIRLLVTDLAGNQSWIQTHLSVEGEQKVGNFTISFIDLDIPVAGIPIQVIRTYDSRDKRQGDFGVGWTLSIRQMEVQESGVMGEYWEQYSSGGLFPHYCLRPVGDHTVSVTMPDGRVERFSPRTSPECQYFFPIQYASIYFVAQSGTLSSLGPLGNVDIFVSGNSGPVELWDWDTLYPWDADNYQLTDLQGNVYRLDEDAGLEQMTDTNGNALTITDAGILHSSGVSVAFDRDGLGRITQVTDPLNQSLTYDYNAAGDLVQVTDREGYATTFTYNSTHGLTKIKDALGRVPARNVYDDGGRLIAIVDAAGNRVDFLHNLATRQEVVRDRLGQVTVYEYDDEGNVVNVTDALGSRTEYTYDERGNKLSETNALSQTTTYTYDAQDNLLSETNALGQTTTYTYNSRGQVLTSTDPRGKTTTYNYDNSGNLLTTTDPLSNTTSYSYDGAGNMTAVTDPLSHTTTYIYDSAGNMTTQTDPLSNTITYTYDANGNRLTEARTRTTPGGVVTMTTQYVYDGQDRLIETGYPDGSTTQTEYNASGQQSATVDQLGRRTSYEYDSRGNLTRVIYPDGTDESYTYDAEGRKLTATNQAGHTTTYAYDTADRLLRTTFPDGTFSRTEYDPAGQVRRSIDERGNATGYEYDAAGRTITVTNALSFTMVYTYDAAGNQIGQVDALGHTVEYEYDAAGRRTRTIFDDDTWAATGYDALGRRIAETDQAGITTHFAYDALGRLIGVTDALSQTTTYAYDEVGNLIAQTDANLHTTTFEYDDLGRRTVRILPLGMAETMVYNAAGNITAHTDFNGDTINYQYDAANRLTRKDFPDGTFELYTYTADGQRETVTDSRGLTTCEYDRRNRLIRRTDPGGAEISYTYDEAGNRTSVTIPSGTTAYTFDALNRLETATDPDDGVTVYTYDAVGNRATMTYPNGTVAEYTYDALNRLTTLENRTSTGAIISSYTYALGPAGNRTRVVENDSRTVDYAYDVTYKLIGERITEPVSGTHVISYTYDAVGNRQTKIDDGVTTTYTYDDNDRLLTENGTVYTYDDNGNTLTKVSAAETAAYTYDCQNRLIEADITAGSGSSVVSYVYDADGIRVRKTVNGVDVTQYLVDANRDYAQVLEERDGVDVLTVGYVYGDDLISQSRGGTVSYYHYDGQMSTRELTDAAEGITDNYTYDAFGVLVAQTGTTLNNYLFTGEQYDPNVSFYYLRMRYYSQESGRFLTADAWVSSVYDPSSLHKYLYVDNDPVNHIDPTGHYAIAIPMIAISLMDILLATAIIASSIAVIEHISRMPVRLNHYTRWEVLPFIMRSGIDSPSGKNYFTPDWYYSRASAKESLALPKEPEILINLTLYLGTDGLHGPSIVQPAYDEIGGGIEYFTFERIPFWPRKPVVIPLF